MAGVKAGSDGASTIRTTCVGANASSAFPSAVACTGSRAAAEKVLTGRKPGWRSM